MDPTQITESVSHAWYDSSDGDKAQHPYDGETKPKYSGPKPPYEFLDVDKKYSWLKSPRYQGKPMEVGPLARMVVGYASGQKDIKAAVDGVLKHFSAPPAVLFSTLGRVAARAIESQLMAARLETVGGSIWIPTWRTARWRSATPPNGIPALGPHRSRRIRLA